MQYCGCPNRMMIVDEKIGAVDLSLVVMLESNYNKKENFLTSEDLAFQEARRQRKVRKLDFEIR